MQSITDSRLAWVAKSLLAFMTAMLLVNILVPKVSAQGSCLAALLDGGSTIDGITNVIQMAGEFPEQSGLPAAKGTFHSYTASLTFYHGQRVILSSSPDGRGAVCSDDVAMVQVLPSGKRWRHEFPNAARTHIEPIAPVDVTDLFQAGDNTVTLTLIDLIPPAFASSPYYLLVVGIPQPTLQPVLPTMPPRPVNTPTPVPTLAPSPTPTPLPLPTLNLPPEPPTATPSPTEVETPLPAPTMPPTLAVTEPTLAVPPEGTVPPEGSAHHTLAKSVNRFPFWPLAILGLTGMAGLGVIVYGFNRESVRLEGLLIIKDVEGKLFATVDLATRGHEATFGSHGPDALPDETLPPVAVKVRAQRTADAVEMLWQVINETGAVVTSQPLQHGDIEQIGPFTFEYQNFAQVPLSDDSLEGEMWDEA